MLEHVRQQHVPNGQLTCDGTNCGFNCPTSTMRCNAGKDYCEKTLFDFETSIDTWASPSASDRADDGTLTLSTARAHGGTHALSAHVSFSNTQYAFRMNFWPCGRSPFTQGGPEGLDLRGKTLTFWVYLAPDTTGVPSTGSACYASGSSGFTCVGSSCTGSGSPVTPGMWSQVSAVFASDTASSSVNLLSIDCRPATSPAWTGTVYVDDIAIQ